MSRGASLAQITVAYALIEVALWTELPWKLLWSGLAAAWILLCTLLPRRSLRQAGLGRGGLAPSAWVAAAGAALAALILLAGWRAGTLHHLYVTHPVRNVALYALWALAQQVIIQSFFFLRLEELLGSAKPAVAATALLFAAAHIPNPVLVPLTLAGGLAFCELFRRYRNLYPLAAAHALLGLALAISLPVSLQHNMRVGIGYFDWHPPAVHVR